LITKDDPTPLFWQIKSDISDSIKSKAIKSGTKLTLDGLSEYYKVTRNTALRAIKELEREKLVTPIRGRGIFVNEVSPVKDLKKASGSEKKNYFHKFIVLMQGRAEGEFSHSLLEGMTSACAQNSWTLELINLPAERDETLLPFLEEHAEQFQSTDGVLLLQVTRYMDLIEIGKFNPNLMTLFYNSKDSPFDSVMIDFRQGMRDLTNYLLELGHEHIAAMHGGGWDERMKREGYIQAMQEQGKKPAEYMLFQCGYDQVSIDSAVQEMLSLPTPPTAIIALDDIVAVRVIQILQQQGLSVPGDISVAGFNNFKIAQTCLPPLTTVEVNSFHAGYVGVKLLTLKIMENTPAQRIFLRTTLVKRASCASPQRAKFVKK